MIPETRREIIKEVRSVKRVCRGPLSSEGSAALVALLGVDPPTPELVLQLMLDWRLDMGPVVSCLPDDVRPGRSLDLDLRTREITAAELLPLFEGVRGNVETALLKDRERIAREIDAAARPGCGADVNDLILAQKLDGQEHAANCPGCQRLITWTAPKFAFEE